MGKEIKYKYTIKILGIELGIKFKRSHEDWGSAFIFKEGVFTKVDLDCGAILLIPYKKCEEIPDEK